MTAKISLCMIVKNEGANLARCLNSVNGIVDEIIIVDTGSTDNTTHIALDYGAQVHFHPWTDNFSDARNASLELATGEWILFLDADEELDPGSGEALHHITSPDRADPGIEGCFVKIINYVGNEGWVETCPDLVFRLFRNRPDYRFRGAIHEQIVDVILEKSREARFTIAEGISIIHYGYLDGEVRAKNKKNRNLGIIQTELEAHPHNRLLRYHFGVELFRAERYAEAAQVFTQAANGIDPNTIYLPKLLRYLVLSHQAAGQLHQALETALLGLRFFPDYADLHYYAGLVYLDLKQYGAAEKSLQQAASMPEQPPQYASFGGMRGFRAYYQLGKIADTFLQFEEALKYYILSLRDNPQFTPALECIVQILKPHKYPQDTKESLDKICEFCTPEANRMIGEIYFRHGAYALALEHFERMTEHPAADATLPSEIRLWKAICLIQEGRHLEALRLIEEFSATSPLYPLAKLNKLLSFWLQGRPQKVRALYKDLETLGLAEDTRTVLSLFLAHPKPYPSAKKQRGAHALTLGSDGLALLADIIQRLLALHEVERADFLLAQVQPASLAPKNVELAKLYYDYDQEPRAIDLLAKHLSFFPDDAAAHFLLAEVNHKCGNYPESEQHYRYAVELNPHEPRSYVRQIELYQDWQQRILAEARQKYPDSEVLRQLAARLETNN